MVSMADDNTPRSRMNRPGTVKNPLASQTVVCPRCNEGTLREVKYGLVEEILAKLVLEDEEKDRYDTMIEVACNSCGWRGTAWKVNAG